MLRRQLYATAAMLVVAALTACLSTPAAPESSFDGGAGTGGDDGGTDEVFDAGFDGGTIAYGVELCLVGLPLSAQANTCAASVCEVAPSCCEAHWGRECIDLAATMCHGVECTPAAATVGLEYAAITQRTPEWETTTDFRLESGELLGAVAWADYDNDGDADLAFVENCGVRIYRNAGYVGQVVNLQPVFENDFQVGETQCYNGSLAWADADADGDLDLAASSVWGVAIVLNDRDGDEYTLRWDDDTHLRTEHAGELTWGDINADGAMDLIVGTWGDNAELYLNTGSGLGAAIPLSATTSTANVETCHLGTGTEAAPGLLVGTDGMQLFENTGTGLAATNRWPATQWPPAGGWADMKCGDVNADGVAEVVAATYNEDAMTGAGHVYVLSGADGSIVWTSPEWYYVRNLDLGDIDGNGRLDVLVVEQIDGVSTPFSVLLHDDSETIGFTHETAIDPAQNADSTRGQLVHFPLPE